VIGSHEGLEDVVEVSDGELGVSERELARVAVSDADVFEKVSVFLKTSKVSRSSK
jgi:hypothetical protein